MLIVKNCPDDPQIKRFIKFVEAKFEWLYPVTLEFKNRTNYKNGWHGYYDPNIRCIRIPLFVDSKHTLFDTIAHEIRHAQQWMHNLDLQGMSIEWDADRTASAWVAEFGETSRNLWRSLDWYASRRNGDASILCYPAE